MRPRRLVIFYLKCAAYKSTYLLTYLRLAHCVSSTSSSLCEHTLPQTANDNGLWSEEITSTNTHTSFIQLCCKDGFMWNKVAWNWFNRLTRIITAVLILNYRLVAFVYSKAYRRIWVKPRPCQINRVDHPKTKTFIERNPSCR